MLSLAASLRGGLLRLRCRPETAARVAEAWTAAGWRMLDQTPGDGVVALTFRTCADRMSDGGATPAGIVPAGELYVLGGSGA